MIKFEEQKILKRMINNLRNVPIELILTFVRSLMLIDTH